MKTPQLLKTTEYKKFKLFKSNREVNKSHLSKLTGSIKQKDLLYLFPIVVNKSMEVVDGQHRLAAAQALNIPIYYFIDDNVSKADIAMVNNNRKGWVTIDFVKFYLEEGVKEYKNLFYVIDKYKVAIIGAARLMSSEAASYYSGGSQSNKVRAGNIETPDFELAKEICETCVQLKQIVPYALKPWFLMDLKYILCKYTPSRVDMTKKLLAKGKMFPIEVRQNSMEVRAAFKNILVGEGGHSKEQVEKFMEKFKH